MNPTLTPERTLDQRMQALLRANEIRLARAQLKRDLKSGEEKVYKILAHPPEYAHSMKVYDLLRATPKIGPVKANRLLKVCGISPSKTLGGMTSRQLAELMIHLDLKGQL